jgi:hypothetical protein
MKRLCVAVAVAITMTGLAYWAVAADDATTKEPTMSKSMMKDGMMGMEMREHMGGMCPGHMMIGRMMTTSQMVAMPDGDVVVMVGNTLTKCDKNLAVVKEIKMKIDTDAMMREMQEMCAKCPACKAMKEGEKMPAGKMKEETK